MREGTPLFADPDGGEQIGAITSGGFAPSLQKPIAMGYVPAEHAEKASGWQIEILGVMRDATLRTEPIWDPNAEKMRG